MTIPRIAISSGEPAGIGPDLCIELAQHNQDCEIVVLGDPTLLQQRASLLNKPVHIQAFNHSGAKQYSQAGVMSVLPVSCAESVQPQQLNTKNSTYVLELIEKAAHGCLQKLFDAMVTAPVHKGIINDAGIPFTGHTEFIAEQTGGHPVMMLATPGLRVALATTHLPLSQVSQAITRESLSEVITILDHDLRQRFGLNNPKILICGLNPHAGENGHLGMEEIETIIPVIQQLATQGLNLHGPLPADTLFTAKYLQTADAVLAMYHDQGLPVLKHIGFGNAVNITLGLPIVRTSVDHGTALDLAGSGLADAGSLQYAVANAIAMTTGPGN
jgi:4-hydroxythreonine-4-phosphate dehydrogenase